MGKLVLAGVHAEGTPVGVWFDAFWASYVDFVRGTSKEASEAIDEFWTTVTARPVAPVTAPAAGPPASASDSDRPTRRRPTQAERDAWGASAAAQAGLSQLMNTDPAGPPPGGAR